MAGVRRRGGKHAGHVDAADISTNERLFLAVLGSREGQSCLASHLSVLDLGALRASSSACCSLLTKRLFARITVTFTPVTFTRPSRMAALGRVGHHVEHLTFHLAHSDATFLPPLVDPVSGREVAFLYSPHTSTDSALARPKYATAELAEMLTDQYPPLFHAATNVPSFIGALRPLSNIRHLTIRCPGQDPRERYRRDIVDYALVSLRIAVERAPLTRLTKLSLLSLHPAAFNYLRHAPGIGSVPSAGRRWRQIRKLRLSVAAWDFYGPSPGLDQLKVMDDYIRHLAPALDRFEFTWLGGKGPCPVALAADPLFAPPQASKKLFREVTSFMSPLPAPPSRAPIHFLQLRHLRLRNTTMNAQQLSELIGLHRTTVREFDFENVVLMRNDSWDEALAPVVGDDAWVTSSAPAPTASEPGFVANDASEVLPCPSAAAVAAAAASRRLLGADLDGQRGGQWCRQCHDGHDVQLEAATQYYDETTSITTKLKKKRRRRRRRKSHHRPNSRGDENGAKCPRSNPVTSSSASAHGRKRSHSTGERREESRPAVLHESTMAAAVLAPLPRPILLQPTIYRPPAHQTGAPHEEGISSIHRDTKREEAHRLLAEDASARVSALQKAKKAVLSKLSRECCGRPTRRATADAVTACRLMSRGDFYYGCGKEVIEDRTLSSQSVLVPLILRRS
ncbi:hypothetical protein RJ55_03168 [Drechmeria coniospora]|nr:hypothetical protein RJ55_03168 [Drechmeria coniospora]